MAINRALWLKTLSEEDVPAWPCPHCGDGTLTIAKRGDESQLIERPDAKTVRERNTEGWYELQGGGVFGAILICQSQNCKDVVSLCGHFAAQIAYDDNQQEYFYSECTPRFFSPALHIFQIPKDCPAELKDEIVAAFSLYWCDQASCLNRIRTAIEVLLTTMKVPRFDKKRRRLNLSNRIDKLKATQPDLVKSLTALRWIGNAGSHGTKASREDALDGFELLEHALEERFVQHRERITKLRREITKAKGPRRTRLQSE